GAMGECVWVEDEEDVNRGFPVIGLKDPNAIKETAENKYNVYPNPTNGILFVQTVHAPSLPRQTYRITNLMGQTVLSGNITAETQQIDVSNLPDGMYFIIFAGETRKFVVR
ncbi:MAG: T9SS type A sorting domain-containing protein, partial [Bacteroidales bacterium]|nr:T9SS type A sorting domain-containing protein [Bacteroidales bacterium]